MPFMYKLPLIVLIHPSGKKTVIISAKDKRYLSLSETLRNKGKLPFRYRNWTVQKTSVPAEYSL